MARKRYTVITQLFHQRRAGRESLHASVLVFCLAFMGGGNVGSCQTWVKMNAPSNKWAGVACSVDGKRLVAVAGGYPSVIGPPGPIIISTNAGLTWMPTTAPSNHWSCVGSSADGMTLVAGVSYVNGVGPLYTSPDAGETWVSNSLPNLAWSSLACSADGSTWFAAAVFGELYISTNFAAAWNSSASPSVSTIACSPDGLRLVAAYGNLSRIYTSTNSGATWITNNSPVRDWSAVASSADGTKMLAITYGSYEVYTSSDSGATWISNNLPRLYWLHGACSADGTKLAITAQHSSGAPLGPIFGSADSGAHWTSNNAPELKWGPIACSADGSRFVAVSPYPTPSNTDGSIWVSEITPSPKLRIEAATTNLLLSWLMPSIDFVLQQTAEANPSNWTEIPQVPFLNLTNLQCQISLPATNDHAFFRLISR